MANLTGYLVVARCGMDDIPIKFVAEAWQADEVGKALTTRQIQRRADKVFGVGVSVMCNVSIVPFVNGIPQLFTLCKEF